MMVVLFIVASVLSGGTLPAVLAGLTTLQWIQLGMAGINGPRDVAKIVHFIREQERRHPCNKACRQQLEYMRTHEVRGGPLGWGRSPMQWY